MTNLPRPKAPAAAPVLDVLTGIASDELFWHLLSKAVQRAQRQAHNLALLAIYVQGLTALNEAHGHEVGDAALRVVASRRAAQVAQRLLGEGRSHPYASAGR